MAIEAAEEVMWPSPDQLEHHTPVIVQGGAEHHQKSVKNAVQTLTEVIDYSEKHKGHVINRIYQETTGCGMVKDFNFLRCPSSDGRYSWVSGDGTGPINHEALTGLRKVLQYKTVASWLPKPTLSSLVNFLACQ